MKRAVIYARVSTDEQAEKSSLTSQVEECRRYAAQQGLSVVKEIADDISGSLPVFDRPGGKILQDTISDQGIDAIIVYRADRLSRRLGDAINAVETWLNFGVVIHILDIGIVKSANDISFVIKFWQGGDEWMKIAERTMGGRNDKAKKEGKIVMSGHPPYGYRREGKRDDARLIIDEQEADIVREIFTWYIRGNGEGLPLSLRAIAAHLEQIGAPVPHFKSRNAERWIPATVRGILTNELYAGRTYYGKTRMIKKSAFQRHGRREKQPQEEWIPIEAPELAIIDRALFEAVQERARRNQEQARRNQKREYLMTGHFRCGACGSAMAGSASFPNGYETIYYRCGNHFREQRCPNAGKTIITAKVDHAVWDWVYNLMSDENALLEGIQRMRERSESEVEPKRERLEQVERLIDARRRNLERLVSELGDEDNDAIRDALKSRVKILGKEIESLQVERDALAVELAQVDISPELEAEIIDLAAEIRAELGDYADFEAKRFLLDKLNVRAVFIYEGDERRLDVTCGIAPEGVSIMLYISSETIHNNAACLLFRASLKL